MEPSNETAVSPLDYLRPVWRFKWIALLIVVVAAAGTYLYTNRQAKKYESSTQLYVGQSDIDQLLDATASNPTNDQRNLANQARLITTPQVAGAVIRKLKLQMNIDGVLSHITVHPDSSADFLTIVSTAGSPGGASAIADAFAQQYLQVRTQTTQRQATAQLVIAREQLARTPKTSTLTRSAITDRIRTLQNAALDPPTPGEQLSPANVPGAPVSPKPTRNAIFAAALALLFAIVLAYVFDRSDERVRSVGDVEELLQLPVLASLPAVKKAIPEHGGRDRIVPELREPSHTLRVSLDLMRTKRRARTVLVTSGLPSEGKSTVTRNLALAYRDAGLRVMLVEADMRRPTIAGLFDIGRSPGLAEVLRGDLIVAHAMQTVGPPSSAANGADEPASGTLDVLVAGNAGEHPGLLLYPVAIRTMLDQLSQSYDVVLIDSPPVLMVSDALVMAPLVDAVVLVVREGSSTRTSVERLRRTFDGTPETDVLGSVLNVVDVSSGYDGYGYYSAYGAPRDDAPERPPSNGQPTSPTIEANAPKQP